MIQLEPSQKSFSPLLCRRPMGNFSLPQVRPPLLKIFGREPRTHFDPSVYYIPYFHLRIVTRLIWFCVKLFINCINRSNPHSVSKEEAEEHLCTCNIHGESNKSVLFVCMDNCCRSTMAEGIRIATSYTYWEALISYIFVPRFEKSVLQNISVCTATITITMISLFREATYSHQVRM